MKKFLPLIISLALFIYCGHKAAPLAKDRLKPKLIKATALNRNQLQCTFSEPVDTAQITADAVTISSDADTLAVITSYPTLSNAEIMFAVESMQNIEYQITGYVFDSAMNKGNFAKKFKGMALPDTIKPSIIKYPRGRAINTIDLTFSEAMDTTRVLFHIIPEIEHLLIWHGPRHCSLVARTDSVWLQDSVTYYLYTSEQLFDLNENPIIDFLTTFTADSSYQPLPLEGKALINDTLVNRGLAVLSREKALGIAIISQGIFKFEVRDSLPFTITVIAGQHSGSGEALVGGNNVIEMTGPKIELDDIIH